MSMHEVLEEVKAERVAQDALWGQWEEPGRDSGEMGHMELFCSLMEDTAHVILGNPDERPRELRAALVKVAAIAVAWIERLDRENTT